MKKLLKMLGLFLVLIPGVNAPSASALTNAVTLSFSNLVTGAATSSFVLPKFNPSLGALQSISIAFQFSGTIVGTASGVNQSLGSTVTHAVFFDFTDTTDSVAIAEPTLSLSANVPAGAQNATIPFGPGFQSTSRSFTVTSGDPRFNAWKNGPGTFNGALRVYFSNTSMNAFGLHFYSGNDSGLYSGWLSITYNYLPVIQPNHAPVASSQSVSVNEDNPLSLTLVATDADGDALGYSVTSPANGSLTGTAPNLTYTPNANFHGSDSFTFKVNDGKIDSAAATISITVISVNDAPVAFSQSDSINEDSQFSLALVAVDADGDTLTYNVTSPTNGMLSGTVPNLTYIPNANFHGTDSFTFKVNDGQLDSGLATVSIAIISVNDAPVASATATPSFLFSSNENSTVVIAPCDGNATVTLDGSHSSDIENDSLEYVWMEGTNMLGTGEIITNLFPIGTHNILLTVNDGVDAGIDNLILEVITPAESVAELILLVEDSDLPNNKKLPLIASLNGVGKSFAYCHIIPGINQLEAFQNKVKAQILPLDAAFAEELLHISKEIVGAVRPAPNDVKTSTNPRIGFDLNSSIQR